MSVPENNTSSVTKKSTRASVMIVAGLLGIFFGAGLYLGINGGLVRAALSGSTVSFNGDRLTNVGDPVSNSDAATKNYIVNTVASKAAHQAIYAGGANGTWNWGSAGSPGMVWVTVCGAGGGGGTGQYNNVGYGPYGTTGCGGYAGSCTVNQAVSVGGNVSYSVGTGGGGDSSGGNSSFGSISEGGGAPGPDGNTCQGGGYNWPQMYGTGLSSSFEPVGNGGIGGQSVTYWDGNGYGVFGFSGNTGYDGIVIVTWFQ